MRTIRWTEAVEAAAAGELAEVWAEVPFDDQPAGGAAHLYGRDQAGKVMVIRPNDALAEAVPEWELPAWEIGWSLADADWLARLLRGDRLDIVTDADRRSAVADLEAAVARLRRAEGALPAGALVDRLRAAITDAEHVMEGIDGGQR